MSDSLQSDDLEYIEKNNITKANIAKRFISLLRRMYSFLTVKKITGSVTVSKELLKRAVFDYYVDIARIKDFHKIPRVNTEKIYGYTAFWLLKRKPLQVTIPFPGSDFVNELFVTSFLAANILAEKGIGTGTKNDTFKNFQRLLCYSLKYRHVSQQSLELMVEAFFAGFDTALAANVIEYP